MPTCVYLLQGMINREHLNATPETNLPQIFSPLRTVDQYGYWLSEVLRKNTTSWLHYNLAAIYWRIKGNAPKALECSRRAVHYSPRYKFSSMLYRRSSKQTWMSMWKQDRSCFSINNKANEKNRGGFENASFQVTGADS